MQIYGFYQLRRHSGPTKYRETRMELIKIICGILFLFGLFLLELYLSNRIIGLWTRWFLKALETQKLESTQGLKQPPWFFYTDCFYDPLLKSTGLVLLISISSFMGWLIILREPAIVEQISIPAPAKEFGLPVLSTHAIEEYHNKLNLSYDKPAEIVPLDETMEGDAR
jgi:hypothetical protein